MLSDRRHRVLSALIEEYVARAHPVGSRTLTERYQLGVSSATVRNDLSALEDAGYITQPHTSSGRIPTDAGYRAFVDELLTAEALNTNEAYSDLISELRGYASELDTLMEQTSATLARMTDCLSIVMAPSVFSSHIRQLSLVSLTNWNALIIVVAEDGQVANRQITFNEEVTPDELARVQNLLNRCFVGKSARDFQAELDPASTEALRDPLVQLIIDEIIVCLHDDNLIKSRRLGMSALMRKPEFQSSTSLLPVVQALEDESILFKVLDKNDDENDEIIVRIGAENAEAGLSGVSVVASSYGRGEGEGMVAVIGPTRMDYSRVIKAVRAAQQALRDE